VAGRTCDRGRRAYNDRRSADRLHRVFLPGNGHQYAGGFPAAGLDAHGWNLHVAGEAEFGWMKLRSNNRMKTMRIALAAYTER
jgi:hypothetical protein